MKKKAMELKVGDVVRLKSGGPEMTVSGTPPGAEAYVDLCWAGGYDKAIFNARILSACLNVVEKKKTQIAFDEGFKTKQA